MTTRARSGALWMWGLIVTISVCILFFIGLAVWAFQDDVELVYDNYYEHDVVFEQQINRVTRTEALVDKPILKYNQESSLLNVKFPLALGRTLTVGQVLLFRPADLHQDRLFPLTLAGDSLQIISLPDMDPGLWRIKLNWTSAGEEYYQEQAIMVN